MDHNDFSFDQDFMDPLIEFFKQIGLDLNTSRELPSIGLKFNEDYYFPTPTIVNHEKKLIKSSIIWDIIEDRKR